MINITKYRTKLIVGLISIFILVSPKVSAELQLSNFTFAYPPEKILNNKIHIKEGLKSYGYLSNVGGVAFDSIAVPKNGFEFINLRYVKNQQDGQRLEVKLKDKTGKEQILKGYIYDWQLIPIAKFVDSNNYACFSPLGELKNVDDEKDYLNSGGWILNYHTAFRNTLLGIRLLQADFLLIQKEMCESFKLNGNKLLGGGEKSPSINEQKQRWGELKQFVANNGIRFAGYLICDHGQKIVFSSQNDRLFITGDPKWFLFDDNVNSLETANVKINAKVSSEIEKQMNEQIGNVELTDNRFSLICQKLEQSPPRLLTKEETKYYNQIVDRLKAIVYPKVMHQFSESYLKYLRVSIMDSLPVEQRLIPVDHNKVSQKIKELNGINSNVYKCLIKTMRYAAFLRYVKIQSPGDYQIFMESINQVTILPKLSTPSVIITN